MTTEDRQYWTNWIAKHESVVAPSGWDAVDINDRLKLAGFVQYVDYDPSVIASNDPINVSRCAQWYESKKDRLMEAGIENPCMTGNEASGWYGQMTGNYGEPGTRYFLWNTEVSKEVFDLQDELRGSYVSEKRKNAFLLLASIGAFSLLG